MPGLKPGECGVAVALGGCCRCYTPKLWAQAFLWDDGVFSPLGLWRQGTHREYSRFDKVRSCPWNKAHCPDGGRAVTLWPCSLRSTWSHLQEQRPSVIHFTELNFESLQDRPMNDESEHVSAPGYQPRTSLILCTWDEACWRNYGVNGVTSNMGDFCRAVVFQEKQSSFPH